MDNLLSELRSKFSSRSWSDTFQLVRRCMERSRDVSIPCEPLQRTMQRLQDVLNVSSINGMKARLESIARQQRLGFHISDGSCYLTADLFYLEVALLPCGLVETVNVAPQGGDPVASASFLELLRAKDFVKFSKKLEDLSTQYNIPGDTEIKLKLFESLQALGKDLEQMSLRTSDDPGTQTDLINNGIVGSVASVKEGGPLSLQYFVSPEEGSKGHFPEPPSTRVETPDDTAVRDNPPAEDDPNLLREACPKGSPRRALGAVVHTALLTVALSDVPHRLQTDSSIRQPPQLDEHGRPVLKSIDEESCDEVPACFLLKLKPAVAMMPSLRNKLSQITDVSVPDADLQWAPLPHLLSSNGPEGGSDEQDALCGVPVAEGAAHAYIFPTVAWEEPARRGTLVDSVPFTHLSHVPALLELLRHQCSINAILSSALATKCAISRPDEPLFEILPESDTSFSVTFHPPGTDSLAVLVVDIPGSRQVACRLFGSGPSDPSVEECLSSVMTRCRSLPVALQTLYSKLKGGSTGLVSQSLLVASGTDADPAPPSPMDTESASPTFPNGAPVPEDRSAASASGSASQSEPPPEINPHQSASPQPSPPAGVYLPLSTGTSYPPEPL